MKARPMSAPPRSSSNTSKTTTLLSLRSAILIVVTAFLSTTTAAGTFELQTNLVSCGSDSNASAAPTAGAGGSTPVAVCSPPESKLFNNVRVVNGTPQPGSTGVRGRLYDVGTLCTEKVADKIDRAWIAFLDCGGGCSLSTKLANLQGSNPQAVLIYNQAACTVDSPPPPAPAGGTEMPTAPTGLPSPMAPGDSPAPATPTANPAAPPPADPAATNPAEDPAPAQSPPAPAATTTAVAPAPAAPTPPVDSKPNGGDEGDSGGDGDSNGDGDDNNDGDDRNDDGEGGDGDDEGDGDNDDSNDGDDDNDDENDVGNENGEAGVARKHPRSLRSSRSNVISLEGLVGGEGEQQGGQELLLQGQSPRPRSVPHPHGGPAGVVAKAGLITTKRRSPRPRPVPRPHGGLAGIAVKSTSMKPKGRSPRPRPIPHPHGVLVGGIVEARAVGLPEPQGRSPRPRIASHPHIALARRALAPASGIYSQQIQKQVVKAVDITNAYVQFPITVAIPEQVTTDYLLKILTGPAAFSPLPAPLKALKTTVNPNGAAADPSNPTAAADANAGVITDLMVSISPAFGEPTGERKFLSMSKPIFATVIGILSAVVCGVVLMYVVRPLVRRQQKGRGGSGINGGNGSTALGDDESSLDSQNTPPSTAGGTGYYGNSTAYSNNIGGTYFDGEYDHHNQYSSKEAATPNTGNKSPATMSIAPYSSAPSQPPPMQEVHSEKHSHQQHQRNDSNSAPTIFDHTPSSNNSSAYPTTPSSARAYSSSSAVAAVTAPLNARDHEDLEYAQRHLELLRRQDLPPLPASTVATPTTAAFAPSANATPTRMRSAWGGYTPTTPTAAHALSTPTSTTATAATATPTTASVEPLGSTSSAFDAYRVASVTGHNRTGSSVVDKTIPEERHRDLLEPAAPQDYSSLTPANSGFLSNRYNNDDGNEDEDDRYSVASSRNGSNLFHSESKPRPFPSYIDTSSAASGSIAAKEGGLASVLYRNHRLSMDGPGSTTFSPATQSPFAGLYPRGSSNGVDSNSTTPRASVSNDFLPSRLSMDSTSYRDISRSSDLQTRFQELMSSSRAPTTSAPVSAAPRSSMDSNGNPRASFSDDYRPRLSASTSISRGRLEGGSSSALTGGTGGTPRASFSSEKANASFSEDFSLRPSLDTLRANLSASTPTPATMNTSASDLMSPLREQRASTANWSRYSRRDSSGASAGN